MRSAAVAAWSAAAMMLTMNSGFGQTQPTQVPPPLVPGGASSAEPVSPIPGAEFQIGPRFWYAWITSGLTKSTSPTLLGSNASSAYPMAGLVGSARFSSLPDTTFVLSALYGKTQIGNSNIAVIDPSNIVATQQSLHGHREDFELLGQTAIPNSNWAWIAGVRWEHDTANIHNTITTFTRTTTSTETLNTSFLNVSGSADIVTLKGGMAGAVPLNAAGDLSFFGNIMLMAGAALYSSANPNTGIVGPDLSVGVQYTPAPWISIDVRYRALVEFIVAQPANSSANYSINQGPMISANFKF